MIILLTLFGGMGDAICEVQYATATVAEAAGEGIDTLVVKTVTPVNIGGPVPPVWPLLAENVENLVVAAATRNTTLRAVWYGNSLDNVMTSIRAVSGADLGEQPHTFFGLAGDDRMTGGGGNDRKGVEQDGNVVIEAAGGGDDWVTVTISYTLPDHVERLTPLSALFGLTGTGNLEANLIEGTGFGDAFCGGGADANDDTIRGGGGDDTIVGGMSENVLLQGDAGSDSFGFAFRDLNVILLFSPHVTVTGSTGSDTLDLTDFTRESLVIDMATQTTGMGGFVMLGGESIVTGEGFEFITNARTAAGGEGNNQLTDTAQGDALRQGRRQ